MALLINYDFQRFNCFCIINAQVHPLLFPILSKPMIEYWFAWCRYKNIDKIIILGDIQRLSHHYIQGLQDLYRVSLEYVTQIKGFQVYKSISKPGVFLDKLQYRDLSSLDDLIKIQNQILHKHLPYTTSGYTHVNDVYIGKNVLIHDSVSIEGPALISDNCIIEKECIIGKGSVICEDCHILKGANIQNSTLFPNTRTSANINLNHKYVAGNYLYDISEKETYKLESSLISYRFSFRNLLKKIWS